MRLQYIHALTMLLLTLFTQRSAAAIRVAVASNFYKPLKLIAEGFQKETAIKMIISQASSGKHFNQIILGAPFDLFLSADSFYPQQLFLKGFGEKPLTYAEGILTIWGRNDSLADLSDIKHLPSILENYNISIANPQSAPYGRAALEVLKTLRVSESKINKARVGESVSQVFHFAHTHRDILGFLALSQVKSLKQPGAFLEIPASLHKPILQSATIIKRSANHHEARAFLKYLTSNKVKSLIKFQGYR